MSIYWEIAAHLAYDMFSRYNYLIVNLVFSHLGFWSGNLFLIAPFPNRYLLVPFRKHGKYCETDLRLCFRICETLVFS